MNAAITCTLVVALGATVTIRNIQTYLRKSELVNRLEYQESRRDGGASFAVLADTITKSSAIIEEMQRM